MAEDEMTFNVERPATVDLWRLQVSRDRRRKVGGDVFLILNPDHNVRCSGRRTFVHTTIPLLILLPKILALTPIKFLQHH